MRTCPFRGQFCVSVALCGLCMLSGKSRNVHREKVTQTTAHKTTHSHTTQTQIPTHSHTSLYTSFALANRQHCHCCYSLVPLLLLRANRVVRTPIRHWSECVHCTHTQRSTLTLATASATTPPPVKPPATMAVLGMPKRQRDRQKRRRRRTTTHRQQQRCDGESSTYHGAASKSGFASTSTTSAAMTASSWISCIALGMALLISWPTGELAYFDIYCFQLNESSEHFNEFCRFCLPL